MIEFRSWRITHHGAVIRQPDGRLPPWWRDEIRPLLIAAEASLREIAARLREGAARGGYRVSRHSVEERLTYISIKSDDDGTALARVRARLEESGLPPELALHHNGNNFALMVKGTQKRDAVRRVARELERDGPIVTVGAGDSLSDIPFLRACDFALVPRDSQIQRETWSGRFR
jgi:hydroxymethylpyrimidine pyrophosphatase-like HAD family hydrolase